MIFEIDLESETPLYLQLRNKIVLGIGKGDLQPDESLPTIRNMARDLGINTMTVNKAYALLKNEGFISINRQHGAVVCVNVSKVISTATFEEKLQDELAVIISESALKGVGKAKFINMCSELFDSMKGLQTEL